MAKKNLNEKPVIAKESDGGIIYKKDHDTRIIRSYHVFEPNDNFDDIYQTIESQLGVSNYPTYEIEDDEDDFINQFYNEANKKLGLFINKVLSHPKVKQNLYPAWQENKKFLEVISNKVVEASNYTLNPKEVKQKILQMYNG
jgi:hypothetical protein